MLVNLLMAELKIDVSDPALSWDVARRGFEKAVAQVNQDASSAYAFSGTDEDDYTLTPDPTAQHREALLILAQRYLAEQERWLNAKRIQRWKSGDKEVDRSRNSILHINVVESLWTDYRNLMGLATGA